LEDLLNTLVYIHSYNIVHRDLKLENIIKCLTNGKYYLVDFGDCNELSPEMGAKGKTVVGSPGYMAPEVALGRSCLQSDLYSLGATAMALLTGKKPSELISKSSNSIKPFEYSLQQLADSSVIRVDLRNLLASMLDARLEYRCQSAQLALQELRKKFPKAKRLSEDQEPQTPDQNQKRKIGEDPSPESKRAKIDENRDNHKNVRHDASTNKAGNGNVNQPTNANAPSTPSNGSTSSSHPNNTNHLNRPNMAANINTNTNVNDGLTGATTSVAAPSEHVPIAWIQEKTWDKLLGLIDFPADQEIYYDARPDFNQKIAVWKGSITNLEVDVIVNASQRIFSTTKHGVNGAVHKYGGEDLTTACKALGVGVPGETKWTKGYNLPCSFVFHTVGPIVGESSVLQNCYESCLDLLVKHEGKLVQGKLVPLKSIAFCCISSGGNGFPKNEASKIAIGTVRNWLEKDGNSKKVDLIVFCLSKEDKQNHGFYEERLLEFFPPQS